MRPGFGDYVREAFNARPIGMFVPPNWIGVAAFGLLGLVNPGFWLLGAGVELGYLYTLVSNSRFRRFVQGRALSRARDDWASRQRVLVNKLDADDRARFRDLEQRCRGILTQQGWTDAAPQLRSQGEGLGRLMWIYLRLLLARHSMRRLLSDSSREDSESLEQRERQLEQRLEDPGLGDQLRKSLSGQLEILQQRLHKQAEARDKLAFLDAELSRIEQQVELIREQAVVATDPETVSNRIDQVAATLGGTTQWIQEQQQILGSVEDLLVDPPPMLVSE